MMHKLSCTTEELAVLASVSGYPEFAKGIAIGSFGERSEKDWELIVQVTISQLIIKQVWNEQRAAEGQIPLTENMQSFIQSYVESKRVIRCSNAPSMSAFMFHKITEDGWLAHSIYKDIIHEFSYAKTDEIPNIIRDYYQFEFKGEFSEYEFKLTDQDFDALNNSNNVERIIADNNFSNSYRESFQKFIGDLAESNWTLYNISNFIISKEAEDTYLENIVFFLPSTNGVWIAEYTDDPVTPVSVRLNPADEWYQVINGVGFVAAASS